MEENRFTVSAVEGESKKNGIHMGANIITRPLRTSAETVERGTGNNAQSDTWLHDAGWRRKRSLAQLTREALPRLDNYRNSKRALKRPSLGELHGDHLITEENFLIAIIVGAMVDFVVGTVMGPSSDQEMANGFVGLSTATLSANFKPDFRFSEGLNQDFFSVFAIFFPSVTGIQAGANISGDLKDPASAIPKGTLLALLISMVSYALMVLFSGGGALRDASGNLTDLVFANGTVVDYSGLASCITNNGTNITCKYGLHNSYSVMQLMSAWGPFIYGGCWAATLSTALTNLLSVPRLIQALGTDRIYPGLIFFSKPYGKYGEPYRGYVLTFFVSLLFLLIADLNTIAPLISNFYLASYALINFCTFHAALVRPLGWRPTFRYYNVWLSLIGFLSCVAIMLLISWVMSLVTFAIFFTLYLIVHYRDPDVNWGSSTQAQIYKTALSSAYNLAKTGEHVKNYWPQLLVLAGRPQSRPALVDLGNLITKAGSLMIVGDISQERVSYKERSVRLRADAEWLRLRKVRAFCSRVHGFGFEAGARALVQAAGVGRLAPNVLLMGYKADWTTAPAEDLVAYFNVLHTAFESRLAVAIVRVCGGLDYGPLSAETAASSSLTGTSSGSHDELRVRRAPPLMHADSDLDIARAADQPRHNLSSILTLSTSRSFTISETNSTKERKKKDKKNDMHRQIVYNTSTGLELSKDQLTQMTIFQRKQEAGTLDVWWLYDDGGLTILLPYIISQRSTWSNCKLRIFALANRLHEMELEERNMANLLAKFRIDYSSLTMVQDITDPPQPETTKLFEDITKKFTDESANPDCCISETELLTLAEKTKRQLRLRELLLANSKDARLVVMSLPMPRKGSVSAPLYMAWLEMMSRDMPPMMFVRGNHTSVLTFYS
ncbi:bumetanide-sensitive sodium-(potassium)-chloride cotransporter isoform X2 [Spodoptera litura]|uniref:Bumetanide-sensitive sodium-(Potassium)-chloride cotransporter isoform X2 n=1 Tax=Spodoptera litura TaxID=69820 RepID=A0A9J7EBN5_SPOLT|nr:bumetanide-sensitive sodium-(potassium)-chloride cotransporter isoform X2 [Spodoptera litura]